MNDYDPRGTQPYPGFDAYRTAAKAERKALRLLGFYIGGAILLYILLQNLLTLPLALPSLHEQYQNDALFHEGVELLVVMGSILPPFLVLSKPMGAVSGCAEPLPLRAPRPAADVLLAVPAGLMFCIIANELTDWLTSAVAMAGVELSAPDLPLATGVLGVTVSAFRVVLMPAVAEELCFRGIVMQHLRRFGNRFAVVTAALCFGLMHCNLIQAPFAFVVGLALGYFVIQTGSLWTAILIHALNNTVSLVFTYLSASLSAKYVGLLYLLTEGALFGCGAVCFLCYLYRRRDKAKLPVTPRTLNSGMGKLAACFSAPTMLLAVAAMLYFTSRYVGLM